MPSIFVCDVIQRERGERGEKFPSVVWRAMTFSRQKLVRGSKSFGSIKLSGFYQSRYLPIGRVVSLFSSESLYSLIFMNNNWPGKVFSHVNYFSLRKDMSSLSYNISDLPNSQKNHKHPSSCFKEVLLQTREFCKGKNLTYLTTNLVNYS